MDLKTYSEGVEKTMVRLVNKRADTIHMLFGVFTEAGELVDAFKRDLAYGAPIDWVNVIEELGDLMWYIVGFCKINDIDLDDVLEKNLEKLKIRYQDKFSSEKAIERNIEAERAVLEGGVD